jgi:hypothetical protein
MRDDDAKIRDGEGVEDYEYEYQGLTRKHFLCLHARE